MKKIAIIIPNWNGQATLKKCIDSLLVQSLKNSVIVVDNGSTDQSNKILSNYGDKITVLKQEKNLGFAGGVNVGLNYSLNENFDFIALFNNDAVADQYWLEKLLKQINTDEKIGIVTSKILTSNGHKIDSTGDFYTIWGLPYPRGRGEVNSEKYDSELSIFSASGGACLFRSSMLKKIGLFDESFFAYYEDVDISFRAQLFGFKVLYTPQALVYHQIGATSRKLKGFTTYQTMKNLPMLLLKNTPFPLLFKILPRFLLVYLSFFVSATSRKELSFALKGFWKSLLLLPKTLAKRKYNIKHKTVTDLYIKSILVYDLPPNATKLRAVRNIYRKIMRRKYV